MPPGKGRTAWQNYPECDDFGPKRPRIHKRLSFDSGYFVRREIMAEARSPMALKAATSSAVSSAS
ncbi:hypothetical protein ABIE78_006548 [Sinorhizobium fredii]